ncbi:hypothetical protein H5410_022010 [Solanum commersonii]|uniref:Uncharacterized protein n=1 Tax=Solanum commersonii TaxID=4109 RepID=A0A9J5ZCZ0_SOLCO|nr:hypothetical protein H5410_022010 [Solanum commersonii]
MEDDFNAILEHLTAQTDDLAIVAIFVYDDYICSQFDKHAWVTLFEEYNERQMLLEVVSIITGSNQEMSDDQLMKIICPDFPSHRNTFICLDDSLNFTKKSFKKRFVSSSTIVELGKHINVEDYLSRLLSLLDFLDKNLKIHDLLHQLCLSKSIYDQRYAKTDVLQLKLFKVLYVFSIEYDFSCVIPQLVYLRYVSARIEKSTDHNSSKING